MGVSLLAPPTQLSLSAHAVAGGNFCSARLAARRVPMLTRLGRMCAGFGTRAPASRVITLGARGCACLFPLWVVIGVTLA